MLCGLRIAETRFVGCLYFKKRSQLRTDRNRNNGISARSGPKCYKLPKGIVSMRTKLANWTRLAVVVVAVFGTQTGCKSGWKMPGTDMFPWSKKPSESTLAGSSPSLSMPSNNPTSTAGPAYKNSPSPLASNATNPRRPTSPYGAVNSTVPAFNMPPNTPTASSYPPNSPMSNNGSGVSAGANGYSTGAYNMAGNTNRTGGFTPPTGYGPPPQSPTGYGPPPQSPIGYGSTSNPNALAGLPPGVGGIPSGLPQASNNLPIYAPMGNANIPALPAAYNAAAVNSMPASSMPNALPNSVQPSSLPPTSAYGPAVAAQTYTGAAPYRPGSVARQTSYDFSNQGAGAPGLPPANVPTTANGLPYGAPNGMNR